MRPKRRIFAISLSNLADLRTSFAKILRVRNGLEKIRTKDFLAQHLQGLSQILVGHSVENVTSLSEIADFRAKT